MSLLVRSAKDLLSLKRVNMDWKIKLNGLSMLSCLSWGMLSLSQVANAVPAQDLSSSSRSRSWFSSVVDRDDPTSQRLLGELEHLSSQFEKRASSLSLNQVLDQGLINNPSLASAFFDIQGSEWSLIASRRSWYPAFQLTGTTANYKGQPNVLIGKAYTASTTNTSTSSVTQYSQPEAVAPVLVLNWSFFDPTRTPAINQVLSGLMAQRFLFDIAARNLILNLQTAYTDVQAESELIRRYRWLFDLTHEQVLAAESMARQGKLSRTALDQLHTEQRLQLTRLIDRYQLLFTASNALAALVAVPPGQLVLAASPFTLEGPWPQDLDTSLQQALAMREEIKQKLSLAERDRWAAIRTINSYLPVFGLTGGATYDDTQTLSSSVQASKANFGLSFQWSFFDGGVKAADATNLRAQSASQRSAADSQRLLVAKQVMDAYNVYVTSKLALQNTGSDFALSRQTVRDAVRAFRANGDVTTLVQVFNLYVSAADRDVGSTRQFNTSIYGLYRYSALWPEGLSQKVSHRLGGA